MTVEGITFDLMRVTPQDDALLYDCLSMNTNRVIKPYANDLALTTTGLNVYVNTGGAIVEGRLIKVTESERLTVPANTTGFICLTIDLTQVNSFTGTPGNIDYLPVNNQVRIEALTTLLQQDLHTGGKIYTYPISKFVSTGSAVTLTSAEIPSTIVPTNSNFRISDVTVTGDLVTMYFLATKHAALASVINNIATIPEGYRPGSAFNAWVGSVGGVNRTGQMVISTNGMVSWYGASDVGTDYAGYITWVRKRV